jgi:hypothetical protein
MRHLRSMWLTALHLNRLTARSHLGRLGVDVRRCFVCHLLLLHVLFWRRRLLSDCSISVVNGIIRVRIAVELSARRFAVLSFEEEEGASSEESETGEYPDDDARDCSARYA